MLNNPLLNKKEENFQFHQLNNNIQNSCEPFTYEINNKEENIKDISNQKKIINNQNINMECENQNQLNSDNYDSDIDDPKYMPNSEFENNINNNNCFQNNYNTFQNNINQNQNELNFKKMNNSLNCFKFHNYHNIQVNQENLIENKSLIELQNENELLKGELYKKAQVIKNKDEIISEFQNLITTFKTKFEQYERKNNQLKQQILFLQNQLNLKNNDIIINSNKKEITSDISLKNNLSYKQHIDDLEAEYNSKIKKLNEKFKEKENILEKDKNEEISKISKNLEERKLENEKLKAEISNYKIEINSLKS